MIKSFENENAKKSNHKSFMVSDLGEKVGVFRSKTKDAKKKDHVNCTCSNSKKIYI